MEELIQIVLSNQSTLRKWKNDFKSEEWKQANELHNKMFDSSLTQSKNCGCLTDFYYALNSKHKIKHIMSKENAQFALKSNQLITLHGLGKILSEYSTEEEFKNLLRLYPNQIDKFERYPENWKEIVNAPNYTGDVDPNQFKVEPFDKPVVNRVILAGEGSLDPRKSELEEMTSKELKAVISEMQLDIPKGNKGALVQFILDAESNE